MEDALPRVAPADVIDALAHPTRRRAIKHLRANGVEEWTVSELAATMAAETSVAAARYEVSLYHHHLPSLDETILVDFDPDRMTVQYRPSEALDAFLSVLDRF